MSKVTKWCGGKRIQIFVAGKLWLDMTLAGQDDMEVRVFGDGRLTQIRFEGRDGEVGR